LHKTSSSLLEFELGTLLSARIAPKSILFFPFFKKEYVLEERTFLAIKLFTCEVAPLKLHNITASAGGKRVG